MSRKGSASTLYLNQLKSESRKNSTSGNKRKQDNVYYKWLPHRDSHFLVHIGISTTPASCALGAVVDL